MNQDSLYALLPVLSREAKDGIEAGKRNNLMLRSLLVNQIGASNSPVFAYLNSQQAVDKELSETKLEKSQAQHSEITKRHEEVAHHLDENQQCDVSADKVKKMINYLATGDNADDWMIDRDTNQSSQYSSQGTGT